MALSKVLRRLAALSERRRGCACMVVRVVIWGLVMLLTLLEDLTTLMWRVIWLALGRERLRRRCGLSCRYWIAGSRKGFWRCFLLSVDVVGDRVSLSGYVV